MSHIETMSVISIIEQSTLNPGLYCIIIITIIFYTSNAKQQQRYSEKIQNLLKWNNNDENAFTNKQRKEQSTNTTPGRSVRNAQRWVIRRKMTGLYMILLFYDCLEQMFIFIRQTNGDKYKLSLIDGWQFQTP